MNIELTDEQKQAVVYIEYWWLHRDSQVIEISGAAGTGKTTLIYYIIEKLGLSEEEVMFMAYVGKATLAMALKGNKAQTIHSSIYDVVKVSKKRKEKGTNYIDEGDSRIQFVLKRKLPSKVKLLVVDEGSMVPEYLARDILQFNIPVIVLGDNNQLPPVFGVPFFLNKPNINLTIPMRQALDSPIIYLAQKAMKGEYIQHGIYTDDCQVIPREHMNDQMLISSDVVVCGKNKTRDSLNDYIRTKILHRGSDEPVVGDKVVCRQNNWNEHIMCNIFLINGLVGYIDKIYPESFNGQKLNIDFRPEFSTLDYFENISLDYKYLLSSYIHKKSRPRTFFNKFEYAYALTAHTVQGSQYNNILVYNEYLGDKEYYKKWLYTAITRAVKGLILVI